jgi:hypothetical protein
MSAITKITILTTSFFTGFLLLSGCSSPVSNTSSSPTVSETIPESVSETVAPVELDEMDVALLAVERSYELFQSAGMTETITSAGDKYILSYDPSNSIFRAALYNLSIYEAVLVEEKKLFTVYESWLLIQDVNSEIYLTPTGLSITNDDSIPFEIVIQDGLIISGGALDGSWTGTFIYEPDFEILALVENR